MLDTHGIIKGLRLITGASHVDAAGALPYYTRSPVYRPVMSLSNLHSTIDRATLCAQKEAMMNSELHRCHICNTTKGRECFSKDRTKKSGLQDRCKECDQTYKRQMRGTPIQRVYTQITDDSFGYWFSGLTDGEAHFQAAIQFREGHPHLALRLTIGLRLDDIGVLETICTTLGIGHVYRHNRWKKRTPNVMHQSTFQVGEAQQLRDVLIPLFDRYPLRTKKARDYAIWREIVMTYGWNGKRENFCKGKPRFTTNELAEVQQLCQELKDVRKYIGE